VVHTGTAPSGLAMAATFLQSLGSVSNTSKASPVLKRGVRQQRLPLKLVDHFNFHENYQKLELTDCLGFGLLWPKSELKQRLFIQLLPLDRRGPRLLSVLSGRSLKSSTNRIETDWEKSTVMNSGWIKDNPIGLTGLARTPGRVRWSGYVGVAG
jgi:hypothetical protein